jgi:hypothetical protein
VRLPALRFPLIVNGGFADGAYLELVVRRLVLLALALTSCGRDAPTPQPGAEGVARGPDPIVLRVPRNGGIARASVYPALDSIIWEATGFPALERVLGFDPEAGLFAVVTRAGRAAHLDLRLGRTTLGPRDTLRSLTSPNGSDIYGVDTQGRVRRLSPSGTWTFTPPSPARAVFAQPDGAILVSGERRGGTQLWRLHPPDDQIRDSVALPPIGLMTGSPVGDRVYLTTDTAVLAIQARTLQPARTVRTRERVTSAVSTPSGDRVFLAVGGTRGLRVIHRFSEGGPSEITLPGVPAELRMDPLGRYLLARAEGADSVWVVAVAGGRLTATLPSRWMPDLPAVAPDGAVATLAGRDVVFRDPSSGEERYRAAGGATEFWVFFHWNGFRPRPPELDVPVAFPEPHTPMADTVVDPLTETDQPAGAPSPQPPADGYTVSFATLLSQQRAIALADSIAIGGARARVVPGEAAGVVIYRVVLGPYATRADAEAAARASGRQFWIFEGTP